MKCLKSDEHRPKQNMSAGVRWPKIRLGDCFLTFHIEATNIKMENAVVGSEAAFKRNVMTVIKMRNKRSESNVAPSRGHDQVEPSFAFKLAYVV